MKVGDRWFSLVRVYKVFKVLGRYWEIGVVYIGRVVRKRREDLLGKRNCREVSSLEVRGFVL